MSKYLLDKFLYTVDRDPELVERGHRTLARLRAEHEANSSAGDPS